MSDYILCSNCFIDEGLKLDAYQLGEYQSFTCASCRTETGKKLNKQHVEDLAYRFFVRGTLYRSEYGAAPLVQFNERQYGKGYIRVPNWLENDIKLIENAIGIGFFYYGPRLWTIGHVKPLEDLQNPTERLNIIDRIITEYPFRTLATSELLYRLRKNPKNPLQSEEYDSPPEALLGNGRLDSLQLPVLYCSQDIEGCVHECRSTMEDDLFLATLKPKRDLKILDLTTILEEDVTEFESLDMAVHMLFFAKEHSYEITRMIALAAKKSGYDGLIYPSYFSQVRNGAMPFQTVYGLSIRVLPHYKKYAESQIMSNICLFGRPIKEGIIEIKCINRLILSKAMYNIHYGPLLIE